MRIIKRNINFKDKIFQVKVQLEENTDDCWNLFNLISDGDFVLGTCFRKIQTFGIQGTVNTEKRRINVLLKVKNFDYQTDNDCIRVNGANAR